MDFSRTISAIYRRSNAFYGKELEKHGVGSGMMMYLMCICDHPGVSQEFVARELLMDKGSVAKAVKQLVTGGYIARAQSPHDNREYTLTATEKGYALSTHLRDVQRAWFEFIARDLTDVERTLLQALLNKLKLE